MNAEALQGQISRLYSSLAEIAGNIDYIRDELPRLAIPNVERLRVENACAKFAWTVYDVRKEIRNLEDKLGLHPGEEPFDPGIINPDPRVTMNFISDWLLTEIEAMHQTVVHLENLSKETAALGIVYILVTESATNILNAFSTVQDTLGSIGAHLERKGA